MVDSGERIGLGDCFILLECQLFGKSCIEPLGLKTNNWVCFPRSRIKYIIILN